MARYSAITLAIGVAAGFLLASILPNGGSQVDPQMDPQLSDHDAVWTNSLGIPMIRLAETNVLLAAWETRRRDFSEFAHQTPNAPTEWLTPKFWDHPLPADPDHPVVMVSRQDAQRFVDWLTWKERNLGLISSNHAYRLMKFSEWETAVSPAVTDQTIDYDWHDQDGVKLATGAFPWGTRFPPENLVINLLDTNCFAARFFDRSDWEVHLTFYDDGHASTAPVTLCETNDHGFFNLLGNISEICDDLRPAINQNQLSCVTAGFSWAFQELDLAHSRYQGGFVRANARWPTMGFRIALAQAEILTVPSQQTEPPPTIESSLGFQLKHASKLGIYFSEEFLKGKHLKRLYGASHPVMDDAIATGFSRENLVELCEDVTRFDRSRGAIGLMDTYRLPTYSELTQALGLGSRTPPTEIVEYGFDSVVLESPTPHGLQDAFVDYYSAVTAVSPTLNENSELLGLQPELDSESSEVRVESLSDYMWQYMGEQNADRTGVRLVLETYTPRYEQP